MPLDDYDAQLVVPEDAAKARRLLPWSLGIMTISLPYLWGIGNIAAPFGAVLLVLHVFVLKRNRIVTITCIGGGILSCVFLAYILMAIGKSFFGVYSVLAWAIAFLAGYIAMAPLGYAASFTMRMHKRNGSVARVTH